MINTSEEIPDNVFKITTRKWVQVYDYSNKDYRVNKEIRFKTSMLRADLCDYSDAYIVVNGNITVTVNRGDLDNIQTYDKRIAFKNNAPFISCITKINGDFIENAEYLDVVMPMYNLIEYVKNYRKTSGSLFSYYRDQPNSSKHNDGINYSIKNSPSFDYKSSILPRVPNYNANPLETDELDLEVKVEIVGPLKHLGNFWRSLDMPLINCEITLLLSWYKECVLVFYLLYKRR